jgi:hypothetical protein
LLMTLIWLRVYPTLEVLTFSSARSSRSATVNLPSSLPPGGAIAKRRPSTTAQESPSYLWVV